MVDKHQPRKTVAWITKEKSVATEDYFRQCLREAQSKGVPLLALRQGGGNDIGFVGISPKDVTSNRMSSWEFLGVPKFWLSDDVEHFLQTNGWSQPSIKTKIKRGGQFIWLFRAKAAAPQKDTQVDFWHYTDDDQTLHLHIAPEQPRKRPQVPSEQIVGPKKRWVDHAPVPSSIRPEIPATVLDTPEKEAQLRDDDKERSPRRSQDNGGNHTKKNERKKTIDLEVILQKESGPWFLFNFGGQGDCAFQAIAGSISKAQGKDLPSEVIVREASRLLVLAVGHILKHKDRYAEKWAPDSDEPEMNPKSSERTSSSF